MKKEELCANRVGKIVLKKYALTRILESYIDINTSVEKAWDKLIDFSSWNQWNSFIPMVTGNLQVGNIITIKVVSPGLKEMIFKPKVYQIEKNKKIVWGGGFLLFVYKGNHDFIIEKINENTIRFRQIEKFQGPIVLLMNKMIKSTAVGYVNMNEEFKKVLENK